ncbi:MAG: DUF2085 domain-containing protein [Anaerolineae bacterium]|nr:DUF2085 domain-containing protein [Anaerolineae bacterium]
MSDTTYHGDRSAPDPSDLADVPTNGALGRHPFERWLLVGIVLLVFAGFVLLPWPLLDKLWAIGYGICPQRASHSFFLNGQQLPVEARMMGMFAGFLLSVFVFAALGRVRAGRLPAWPILVVLVLSAGSMAIDGTNNTFYDLGLPYLYAPYNPARLVTGLLMGAAMAGLLWPIFNMTVWREYHDVPVLNKAWQLIALLAVLGVFATVILTRVDWLLYPVSLLTTAGELALLTTLGAVVAVPVLGRFRRAETAWDLLPAALSGLVFAALLLGVMSAMRYVVIGLAPLP